jgi:ABC-type cobalamin transport system ATPase subunit
MTLRGAARFEDDAFGDAPRRGRAMTANPLVETWRLVSFEAQNADGRVTHPFGPNPQGFLTYTTDGRMAGQIGRSDRPHLGVADWLAASDAEIAAAARDYFAYCGTYEFRGTTVVHRVDLSLIPNRIGGELVRVVALNGDTLTLSTPYPVRGQQQAATLVWRRMSST